MADRIVTIDFESEGIEQRPDYPPKPVGVSVKIGGKRSEYLAWGHPTENNCDREHAVKVLRSLWSDAAAGKHKLLFHNSKFDVDEAETHMGCPRLHWSCYHDTLFQLFLDDPHAPTYQPPAP